MTNEIRELIEYTKQKFIDSANFTKTRRAKICYDPSEKPYRFYYIQESGGTGYRLDCNSEICAILGTNQDGIDNPKQVIENDLSIAVFGEPNKLEAVAVENIMAGEETTKNEEDAENEEKYGFKVFGGNPDLVEDKEDETRFKGFNQDELILLNTMINMFNYKNLKEFLPEFEDYYEKWEPIRSKLLLELLEQILPREENRD